MCLAEFQNGSEIHTFSGDIMTQVFCNVLNHKTDHLDLAKNFKSFFRMFLLLQEEHTTVF